MTSLLYDDLLHVVFCYTKWSDYIELCNEYDITINYDKYFKDYNQAEIPRLIDICSHNEEYPRLFKYIDRKYGLANTYFPDNNVIFMAMNHNYEQILRYIILNYTIHSLISSRRLQMHIDLCIREKHYGILKLLFNEGIIRFEEIYDSFKLTPNVEIFNHIKIKNSEFTQDCLYDAITDCNLDLVKYLVEIRKVNCKGILSALSETTTNIVEYFIIHKKMKINFEDIRFNSGDQYYFLIKCLVKEHNEKATGPYC